MLFPQPDIPQIAEVWATRFLFHPIFHLSGKYGWDPFSSLIEIVGEGQEPSTGPRFGTNSPMFLGHGLVDFCAVFTIRHRIYPTRIRQRCFLKNSLVWSPCWMWCGPVHPKSDIFYFSAWHPYTDFRSFRHTYSITQSICRTGGKFSWDPFSGLGEFVIKFLRIFLKI